MKMQLCLLYGLRYEVTLYTGKKRMYEIEISQASRAKNQTSSVPRGKQNLAKKIMKIITERRSSLWKNIIVSDIHELSGNRMALEQARARYKSDQKLNSY